MGKLALIGIGGYILYQMYENHYGAGSVATNAANTTPNIPQTGMALTPAPSNIAAGPNTGVSQGGSAQPINLRISPTTPPDPRNIHGGNMTPRGPRNGMGGLGMLFTGPVMSLNTPVTQAGVIGKGMYSGMSGMVRATGGEVAVSRM